MSEPTFQEAMDVMRKTMRDDDDIANGWHANLAVMMTDAGVPYDEAQERASGFMNLVFERPTINLQR